MPEIARTIELSPMELQSRLSKTGGTPYYCRDVQCEIAPGLTLSAASINALRRDVLNLLTAQRARREIPQLGRPRYGTPKAGPRRSPEFTVQVTTRDQITSKVLKDASLLYVPLHILSEDLPFCQELCKHVKVCAVLPRIAHDRETSRLKQRLMAVRSVGVTEVLAGNLGLLPVARSCGMRVRGDFGLNIYNSMAMAAAADMELRSACLSFEMTLPQIRDISKTVPCEILAYGRMPLMITENCLIKGRTGKCTCHLSSVRLTDKTGAEFPVIRDADTCRSVLLNGKKLNLLDRQDTLSKLGLWAMRLYFTTENPKEVDQVLASCQRTVPFDPGACTRGLYLRGLE